MDVLLVLVFGISFIAAIIFLLGGIITALRKKPSKKVFKRSIISFGITILSFLLLAVVGSSSTETETTQVTETETLPQESSTDEESNEEEELTTEPVENAEEESEPVEEDTIDDSINEEEPEVETQEETTETLQPEDYRTDLTYEDLARNPDDYIDEPVKMSGTIVQLMEGDGYNQARVAINDNYDEVVLIEYYPVLLDTNLLEDDYITFYGTSLGTTTYETIFGAQETIPAFFAPHIELAQ